MDIDWNAYEKVNEGFNLFEIAYVHEKVKLTKFQSKADLQRFEFEHLEAVLLREDFCHPGCQRRFLPLKFEGPIWIPILPRILILLLVQCCWPRFQLQLPCSHC